MSAPAHVVTASERDELVLLESMMLWPDEIPAVRQLVDSAYFMSPQNAARFRGMLLGFDAGAFDKQNDLAAICKEMDRRGELAAAGGEAGMAALVDGKTLVVEQSAVVESARALIPFELFDHLGHRERPAFPDRVFPPWLSRFADELTNTLETPVDMAGAIALGALSVARQGRSLTCIEEQWREPGIVWMCPVAASGQKKSALLEAVITPIRDLEREVARETALEVARDAAHLSAHEEAVTKGKRNLAKALGHSDNERRAEAIQDLNDLLKEQEDASVAAKTEPRWITNDATPEALAELLATNDSRISLVSSEGREIFDMMLGRYSDRPNLEVYLRGHAGEDSATDRKGKSALRVEKGCLTVFAMIQPGVLESIRQDGLMKTSGLLARCVFIYPDSPDTADLVFKTDPISSETIAEYERRVRAMAYDHDKRVLKLSDDARAELLDFQKLIGRRSSEREDGDLVVILEWASKLPGLAVRFATLLHEADHAGGLVPEVIGVSTMKRGCALAKWAAGHALFSGAETETASGHAGALSAWQFIASHTEGGEIRARTIQQGTKNGRLKQKEERDRALFTLSERGYIARLPGKKRRFAVNPEALRQHPIPGAI